MNKTFPLIVLRRVVLYEILMLTTALINIKIHRSLADTITDINTKSNDEIL